MALMPSKSDRLYSYIGLACRAGKLVSGFQACEDAIKHKKAQLVLLSGEMSPRAAKDYTAKALAADISCIILEDDRLGASIGRPERKIVCIIGKEFADTIIKEWNLLNNFGGVEQA